VRRSSGPTNRAYISLLQLVYDFVYLLVLTATSPYLLWMMAFSRKHRAGIRQRLGFVAPFGGDRPRIWIHGVSVGEVLAAQSLIEVMEREVPDHEVVISTTTRTGQEVAAKRYPGRRVFYYPLDFSWSTRRVLRRVRPVAVILMELEIWPNFLLSTSVTEVPVLLVNGRISSRSYRRYGILQRVIPEPMDRIVLYCVQTRKYAERFRRLGVRPDRIHVTGTMKFDNIRTEDVDAAASEVRRELGIAAGERVLMGGSTHPTEEEALLRIFRRLVAVHPDFRLVLVPRHPERLDEVESLVRRHGFEVVRKTRIGAGRPVVLVDTMGELARIYAAADLVFVGGSLIPHGGQNMMEPAGLGRAVLFGPHVENFRETVDVLLEARGVRMAADPSDLEAAVLELAADPAAAREMGARARRVIIEEKGASERIMAHVRPFIEGTSARESGGEPSGAPEKARSRTR
jgi:3-deoxy-D-manno-octulosonic-acid transferase